MEGLPDVIHGTDALDEVEHRCIRQRGVNLTDFVVDHGRDRPLRAHVLRSDMATACSHARRHR
jgi:hypothetical protein